MSTAEWDRAYAHRVRATPEGAEAHRRASAEWRERNIFEVRAREAKRKRELRHARKSM